MTRYRCPETRRSVVTTVLHGVEVHDPYRWLERDQSPEVQDWIDAQDRCARTGLAAIPGREAIRARLEQLLGVDTVTMPLRRGPHLFHSARRANGEQAVVFCQRCDGQGSRVVLDPNGWSADGVSLGEWYPSRDGSKLAFATHGQGGQEVSLRVLDVASGEESLVDVIPGAEHAVPSWSPAGDGFYYARLPRGDGVSDAGAHVVELRFHELGQDPSRDRLIQASGEADGLQQVYVSRDGRWLIRTVTRGWYWHDIYYRSLRRGFEEPWRPLVVDRQAVHWLAAHRDRFYVLTDDEAPRGCLYLVDPRQPERNQWRPLLRERRDATLIGFRIIGERLVVNYLKGAASLVEIRSLDGQIEWTLALPGLGTVGGPCGDEDSDEAFYTFTSFTHPTTIHSLSVRTGATRLWSRPQTPFDAEPYVTEQVHFPSRDGTAISMFIVRRRDLKRDGSSRALLTGYGGFRVSQTPRFNAAGALWLERGGVWAIPNLRGGGEYGREWHEAGMATRKQNVVDDLVAAAQYLVDEGYTRPGRLAVAGASNGGLTVAAALTQRPDLFRVALCASPLADMVRFPLFGAGETWMNEYGSPDDEADFPALKAYSPYHAVKPGIEYPAVLVMSGDRDDVVDPMHARKLVAALQAASSGGPVWLRVDRSTGHAGPPRLSGLLDRLADEYNFALGETASDS